KVKTELLAGVSHDLRTPLATLVFTLQSLQRFSAEHSSETRDELTAIAEKEARRLAQLVDALLDASRLEAGASPVQVESIAPETLVAEAIEQAGVSSEHIRLQASPNLPTVKADPALAVRALANVIENAVRHGDGAQTPVEIDLRHEGGDV